MGEVKHLFGQAHGAKIAQVGGKRLALPQKLRRKVGGDVAARRHRLKKGEGQHRFGELIGVVALPRAGGARRLAQDPFLAAKAPFLRVAGDVGNAGAQAQLFAALVRIGALVEHLFSFFRKQKQPVSPSAAAEGAHKVLAADALFADVVFAPRQGMGGEHAPAFQEEQRRSRVEGGGGKPRGAPLRQQGKAHLAGAKARRVDVGAAVAAVYVGAGGRAAEKCFVHHERQGHIVAVGGQKFRQSSRRAEVGELFGFAHAAGVCAVQAQQAGQGGGKVDAHGCLLTKSKQKTPFRAGPFYFDLVMKRILYCMNKKTILCQYHTRAGKGARAEVSEV